MAYTGPLQLPTLPTNFGSGRLNPGVLGQIGKIESQPKIGVPSATPGYVLEGFSGIGQPPLLGNLSGGQMPTVSQTFPTSMNWPGFIYGNPARAARGAGAAPASLTGQNPLGAGPVSGYDPAYGGVPSAPNPVGTGADAIAGNLANLSRIYNLATGTSGASAAGALTQLNQNLPGASGALGLGLGNTESLLQGHLDPLTMAQYQEDAAQRGVNIGAPGSPNVDAGYLRALGLGRIGLQQQGLSNLGSLIGMTPTGPKFDPSSMEITPAQQQLAQILSNFLAAAPNPAAAKNADLNSLLAGLNRGRGAGTPAQDPFAAAAAAFPPINPASLGFGFGTLGRTGATPTTLQGPLAGSFGGSGMTTDPYNDPTQWMSQTDLQQWNQLSPDDQWMEQLMGYPSFQGNQNQTVSVPGSEMLDYGTAVPTDPGNELQQFQGTDLSDVYDLGNA